MIASKIPLTRNGQILTANLVNHIISRTEYAARLLREYRCVAGTDMFVEPHYDGTRISSLVAVGGGADGYGGGDGGGARPTEPLTPDQKNLFALVGRDGNSGTLTSSQIIALIYGGGGIEIDLADITTFFGANARLECTLVVGEFLTAIFGFLAGEPLQAYWIFAPGSGGTHIDIVPTEPPPPRSSKMTMTSGYPPPATISFRIIYL